MKNKLNITIDDSLLQQAKRYAADHNTSVSKLVTGFFSSLTRPARKKNILQLMEELPEPKGKAQRGDLKDVYFEERKQKYGF